ncbi:MAG: amidohydrolase family protein, partial [Gordonia sp. (in: high G+C Gram-positive bacteria)]
MTEPSGTPAAGSNITKNTDSADTFVFDDVTVFTGGAWVAHQDVTVTGAVISDISDATNPGNSRHRLLIPGFVNTHCHMQQSLMRGIAECTPLLQWLLAVGEESVAITPERAYLATVAASLEALRSGTTALVEHMWPHPSAEVHDAVVRALRDTGIRAVLGRGVADRPDASRKWGFEPRLMQPLDEVTDHVDALRAQVAGSPITVALAVPNPRSLTPEGMGVLRAFAADRELSVSIHLLETLT